MRLDPDRDMNSATRSWGSLERSLVVYCYACSTGIRRPHDYNYMWCILSVSISGPRGIQRRRGAPGFPPNCLYPLTSSPTARCHALHIPTNLGYLHSFHSTPCSEAHYYRVCRPPIQRSAPKNHNALVVSLKNGVMECVCDWSGFWAFGQT